MDAAETAQAARGDRRRHAGQGAGEALLVLTLGMAPEDAAALAAIRDPSRFRYHPLGAYSGVADPEHCRPREILPTLAAAARHLTPAPRAVLAFDDYPASPLAALLAPNTGAG